MSKMRSASNNSKNGKTKKIILIILAVLLAICILGVGTFFVLNKIGKKKLVSTGKDIKTPAIAENIDDGLVVEYNGKTYKYNKDNISLLFMGIDKDNLSKDAVNGKNGQADSIFVTCLNTKTGVIKIIPINREAMVDVNVYTTGGEFAETKNQQLCCAYAYGSTAEEGCENMLRSVKRLLYGVDVNAYAAMDLTGIEKLTNATGGVTLNSIETVGSFKEGQSVQLKGKKAVEYVRARGQDVDGSYRRLQRQKQFLTAFISDTGNKVLSNFTKLTTYYNAVNPYLNSNLSLSEITYIATSYLTANMGNNIEYVNLEGTRQLGEKYVEFIPDETSLYEAVLSAFYIVEE